MVNPFGLEKDSESNAGRYSELRPQNREKAFELDAFVCTLQYLHEA